MNHDTTKNDPISVGIVGAGSWGTALAEVLASKGLKTDLWAYEPEVVDQIKYSRENRFFLPGFSLSENIFPTNDIASVVSGKDMVVVVVPSHFVREITKRIGSAVSADTIIVSASKGIENATHMTMSAVIRDSLPGHPDLKLAVLSGPSFAREVAGKVPTVITVAAYESYSAEFVQEVFATPYFRVYTSHDIIGVELGGSVKNVIAIAAGIVDGLNLGLNTRAALVTRGLSEIRRLGLKLGADPRTFTGPAGLGDLLLTCTGDLSRNHMVGKKIGQGMKLPDILSQMRMVAEGVKTAKSVYNFSKKLGVEMPIVMATYRILYEGLSPTEALHQLMTRDLRHELDDEY
ncbi:MAG: NAD(P)H-dependent glycerol-3-phosphate dehydrogenase [Desulfobacterales bacterium]